MSRRLWPLPALVGVLLASMGPTTQRKTPKVVVPSPPPRVPVARVSSLGKVEYAPPGGTWKVAPEGYRLQTGDRLRTGPDSLAHIAFPWMALRAGPNSIVAIPEGLVLSTVLELGRVELRADGGEIIKLQTSEAEIRGAGRIVVRREGSTTFVATLDGSFRLESAGKTTFVKRGEGSIVKEGLPASPATQLPPAPAKLKPGQDAFYVRQGEPASLSWTSEASSHHLQVLPINSDEVVIEQDVKLPPQRVMIPWLGTFRWHVSSRDSRGLEGRPSEDGLICVVER